MVGTAYTEVRYFSVFPDRVFCFCITLQLVSASDSYSEWLSMTRRAEKRERRKHRKNMVEAPISVEAPSETLENLITSANVNDCCKNGGLCIMNSFCHCKKQFYGRYCQHRVRHQSCGTVAHGTWLTASCNLCHCYDGQMICKAYQYPGCDETFEDGVEQDPDYSGGIEKAFEDYEKFYDDYEDSHVSAASSLKGRSIWAIFMLVCWFITGLLS